MSWLHGESESATNHKRFDVNQFYSFQMLFYSTHVHKMLAHNGIELIDLLLNNFSESLISCLSYGHGILLAGPT